MKGDSIPAQPLVTECFLIRISGHLPSNIKLASTKNVAQEYGQFFLKTAVIDI
jgi:hypothetical protein